MSKNEIREAISALIHTYRRTRAEDGLNWIIRQVANGFVDDANNYDDSELFSLLIDDPDPGQVLENLLNAVQLVFVETALMEEHIYHFFCAGQTINHSLFDLYDTDNDQGFVFDLSGPPSDERKNTSSQLGQQIEQMERLLHDDSPNDTLNQLSYALSNDIVNAWNASRLSLNNIYSLYALYIFTLVVETAGSEGAEITYWDRRGQLDALAGFRVATHPVHADNYVFAQLYFSSRRYLEVHMGTRFTGKSGVEHDYDIALLRRKSANNARSRETPPSYRNLLFALECKFYAGNIQLNMARECLGLIDDLTTSPRGRNLYVTSSAIVEEGTKLLEKHYVTYYQRIVPSTAPHDGLVADVREIFRQYKLGEA